MHPFKKMILSLVLTTIPTPPVLEQSSVSSTSQPAPEGGCGLIVDSICFVNTATNGVITSGDIVYQDINGTNPILGGNQYYKISLVSSYIVRIDNSGVILVHSICA